MSFQPNPNNSLLSGGPGGIPNPGAPVNFPKTPGVTGLPTTATGPGCPAIPICAKLTQEHEKSFQALQVNNVFELPSVCVEGKKQKCGQKELQEAIDEMKTQQTNIDSSLCKLQNLRTRKYFYEQALYNCKILLNQQNISCFKNQDCKPKRPCPKSDDTKDDIDDAKSTSSKSKKSKSKSSSGRSVSGRSISSKSSKGTKSSKSAKSSKSKKKQKTN
jgi:hypothetical protein